MLAVLVDVDLVARDARIDRRFGDSRRNPEKRAAIEGLGNQVLAAELERLAAIRARNALGHVFFGEIAPAP